MIPSERPLTPRSTLIALVLSCITVFIAGVVLLVIGFAKFTHPSPSVPYMWSVTLCPTGTAGRWVGMELSPHQSCPNNPGDKGQEQYIKIPPGILIASVPYDPVIYVTNKVLGTISFSHNIDGEVIFSTSQRLASLEETKFAVCGGKELVVYRDGPINKGEEGDYITTECQNIKTGCQYEPGRSLNKYNFDGVKVTLSGIPPEGSELVIDSITILETDVSSILMPDFYIHYEVGGRSEEQDLGLILLCVGGVLADLMPAAIYFLVSKPAVPG